MFTDSRNSINPNQVKLKKIIPRQIIIKLLKTKGKENILKQLEEK